MVMTHADSSILADRLLYPLLPSKEFVIDFHSRINNCCLDGEHLGYID
jgi:hypothetical protein